jgi:hypothetical protein
MVEKYGSQEPSKLSSYLISLIKYALKFRNERLASYFRVGIFDSRKSFTMFFLTISALRISEQNVRILCVLPS